MTSKAKYRTIDTLSLDIKETTDAQSMKSFETLEEPKIVHAMNDSTNQHGNGKPQVVSSRHHRNPRRAALLSVMPGLGQLYNGETGKGLLFVGVSLANLLLITLLFCTEPLLKGLTQIAISFHASPKLDIQHTLEIIHTGRGITLVYLALILSFAIYAAREAYDHAKQSQQGKSFARFILSLPEATSGSYLFHFSIICALVIILIFYVAPQRPQEQATEIELVQEEVPKPQPPPPAPPMPKKQEPPQIKKVETPKQEPVVKPQAITPPTPVAVAVPTDEPVADPVVQSNEATGPASSDSNSTAGGGGANGDSGQDVDFGSYLAEVQKRIKKNWYPPRGEESKSVTLKFKVRKDGSAYSIKLVTSSGLSIVDQAAVTAVKTASPFPTLPAGSPDEIDIKFTFDYNVFNGRRSGANSQ